MVHVPGDRTVVALAVAASLVLTACGVTAGTPIPTGPPPSAGVSSLTEPPASASGTTAASAAGFAFAAEDIAAYYESRGYACGATEQSATVTGFMVRVCKEVDDAGRTHTIGLVTDPGGHLANAFASVNGNATESILAPIDALYPLSGFLGATLGEVRAKALLTWLASHLGDAHAETMSGPITVSTHTASAQDHATLYVEVASQAYLDGLPSPSSGP